MRGPSFELTLGVLNTSLNLFDLTKNRKFFDFMAKKKTGSNGRIREEGVYKSYLNFKTFDPYKIRLLIVIILDKSVLIKPHINFWFGTHINRNIYGYNTLNIKIPIRISRLM